MSEPGIELKEQVDAPDTLTEVSTRALPHLQVWEMLAGNCCPLSMIDHLRSAFPRGLHPCTQAHPCIHWPHTGIGCRSLLYPDHECCGQLLACIWAVMGSYGQLWAVMGMLLTTSAAASFLHAWAVMGSYGHAPDHECCGQLLACMGSYGCARIRQQAHVRSTVANSCAC